VKWPTEKPGGRDMKAPTKREAGTREHQGEPLEPPAEPGVLPEDPDTEDTNSFGVLLEDVDDSFIGAFIVEPDLLESVIAQSITGADVDLYTDGEGEKPRGIYGAAFDAMVYLRQRGEFNEDPECVTNTLDVRFEALHASMSSDKPKALKLRGRLDRMVELGRTLGGRRRAFVSEQSEEILFFMEEARQRKAREKREQEIAAARTELGQFGFDTDTAPREGWGIEYVVDRLIARREVVGLIGRRRSFKSFVAVSLAVAVASGRSWMDRGVNRGGVLYLALEDKDDVDRRIEAQARRSGVARDNLPIDVLGGTPDLRDERTRDAVVAFAETLRRQWGGASVGLVIVDSTFLALGKKGNENETEHMTAFGKNLIAIARRLDCSVLFVHHTAQSDPKRSRGADSLPATSAAMLLVERGKGTSAAVITVIDDRFGRTGQRVRVALVSDDRGVGVIAPGAPDLPGAAAQSEPRLSKSDEIALKAFDAARQKDGVTAPAHLGLPAGAVVVPKGAWREEAYRLGISNSDDHRARWKAFKKAGDRLAALGLVMIAGDWAWAVTSSLSPSSPYKGGGMDDTTGRHVVPVVQRRPGRHKVME
jgi:hypothetical protein